ncbi:hypothetical protein TRFO_05664 [Tritrichomonas foetus]|uniref:Coiled-coil domain-containing protein 40 n=1 Tax=Tritrichomonas foetus TaxID=1144522 RepID=A0A1J4K4A9_9EUKA|nr:hypothetical protein TRFO_05664 [Tritrichomonas foetus]|eukprot:OHT06027.1 hypothetical protein TRFO_05664 [Tritrichomonas foetus]
MSAENLSGGDFPNEEEEENLEEFMQNMVPEEYDNEEEEFGENDGDFSDEELDPDNPTIAKLQKDLNKQLRDLWDSVDVAIRDKQAEIAKLTNDRENVGVELYSIQQTLAKLQTRLTNANEQREICEQERRQTEEELAEYRQALEESEADLKIRNTEYERNRSELDKLNEIVLRLEQHNQETKNQVAVTRRETYKSEQAASETEASKLEQDLYIDRLTKQVKDITKDLSTMEAQIIAQRAETKTARDALLQASLEMEKINFERNHLLQDWNSSLISVKRRAVTLDEIKKAAAAQEEEIRALQNENSGLKTQIQQQHDIKEKNQILYNKIMDRLKYLMNKIDEANRRRADLQNQLENLCQLCKDKEQAVSKALIEKNQATSEFNQSLKGANEISNRIHELEDSIMKHMTEQSDLKRDTIAAQNAVQKVRDQIAGKDRELSNLRNEVVRLKIDKLNIVGQSEKLERGLKEIVEELQQKDNLINQYEMQIRRNNVDIEKRQSEVDKLNRQYDALKSAQNGEEYGPLERKIRVLQSKIEATDEASIEAQAQWLKKQTELVALEHNCDDIETLNNKTTAHIAVLSRKRDRTRNNLQATEKEIERLNVQIRVLQREMQRLGEQLSMNSDNGNVLVEGNIHFEAEILEGLQRKEEEAANMSRKIEELAVQREQLADELMDTEKEIMLWEKKLVLMKQMKDALDPNYGASELRTMKKEIARMELRLKQIKKQQGVIVQEMEFALKRRETIATRGAVQKRLNKDRTRADIAKGITELKREVRRLNEETNREDEAMQLDVISQRELTQEIEQLTQVYKEVQLKKAEIERAYNEQEKRKIVSNTKLTRLHEKTRLLQRSVSNTKVKTADKFQQQMTQITGQEKGLDQLISLLESDFPHLKPSLEAVKEKMIVV